MPSSLADAGMLGIPTAVIDRDGPLSDEERKLLERHPLVASVLLDNLASFPREISEAISRHHERLNGTGYPQHLTGEHLDPIARMYAVADVFVALRCRRPYRSAYSQKQALTQLLEQVEQGCLDEHWCCSLLNIGLYPVGAIVELSTGETAEVVAPQEARSQPALAALPIVRMLSDREGNPFPANQFQNLAQYPHLRIVRLIP
ncbi:MAG: HD domain-containing phosphohydrolase [Planctomycetota bacterium]